jgi:hypothetical protein
MTTRTTGIGKINRHAMLFPNLFIVRIPALRVLLTGDQINNQRKSR